MVWAVLLAGMFAFKANAASHLALKLGYPVGAGFNYEYVMKNGVGIGGNVGYFAVSALGSSYSWLCITGEGKKYIHEEKREKGAGAYLGGIAGVINISATSKEILQNKEYKGSVNFYTLAGLAGYKWVWGGFALGLEAGMAYITAGKFKLKAPDGTIKEVSVPFSQIGITGAMTLGFVF